MDNEKRQLENYLIDTGIATQAEVDLVCNINGYNLESLEDILFCRTGYRSLSQAQGFIEDNEDDDNEDDDNE